MDKSEGTDFISKTFGSVSEKVARWYHKGRKQMSLSQLKRARTEKLTVLGTKVAELLKDDKLSPKAVENEYLSVIRIDEEIAAAEKELSIIESGQKEEKKNNIKAEAKKTPTGKPRGRRPGTKTVAEPKTSAAKAKGAKTRGRRPGTKKTGTKPLELPVSEHITTPPEKLPAPTNSEE
jgi:hypothetical protein